MTDPMDAMLSDWFDDEEANSGSHDDATGEELTKIAESLLVHGLLSDMSRRDEDREAKQIQAVMQKISSKQSADSTTAVSPSLRRIRNPQFAILSSALMVAAAVIVMFIVVGPRQNISAAMLSLEKVLKAAEKPIDRTYRIHVVEEYSRDRKPRRLSWEAWNREAKQQIDGATLYVRGANQYVLTVLLRNGVKRTSGCDGEKSWAFRENGPVHVSADLSRFRGGVPGHQQDIPFMNIHSHLSQLRNGYEVDLTDGHDTAGDGTVLSQLVGVRKSRDVRGPREIEVWFDAENGTAHRMLFDGLPRGRGGPKSVMLKLVGQSDLAPRFFSHESHHEPQRSIRPDGERL